MFVQNIEKLAADHNMSLSAIAKSLGMSNNAATKWRNGSIPNSKNLQKIADFFGVTVEYLLSDNQQAGNRIGNATNSTIVQGVTGRDISVGAPASTGLSENEQQLLKIYQGLDLKGRTLLMMRAIELQEEMQKR